MGSSVIDVKTFGAVGDGVTNDSTAIDVALASGKNIIFPSGNYFITTTLTGPASNVNIVGQNGTRIFSDSLTNLMNLVNSENVVFENIVFETTLNDPANSLSGGLIRSLSKTLKNIRFINCKFIAINRAVNGVKIISDGLAALAVDNILFRNCIFDRCGRMGFEIQDHTGDADTTIRVRNVRVENCEFLSCGNVTSGIALSFSGRMMGCKTLNSHFSDSATIAIEYARDHQYAIVSGNTFANLGTDCKIISMSNNTNNSINMAPTVTQNKTFDRTGKGCGFDLLNDARFSDNVFITAGLTMDIRRSRRTRAKGELYDSASAYALYLESASSPPCEKNTWDSSDLRSINSSVSLATVRFVGGACTSNQIRNSRIAKGTSGVEADQINGAVANELFGCEINSSFYQPFSTIALPDADLVLSLQRADSQIIEFTGTLTAARLITFPRARRTYTLKNSTNQTLNISTPTAVTPVVLTTGSTIRFVMNDAVISLV